MDEGRPLRRDLAADVKGDAGIALCAVPVTPIPLQLTEREGYRVGRCFDFL